MDPNEIQKPTTKFGTRHVQTLIMATSLIIAYGMRNSISVAVVPMTSELGWSSSEKSLILSSFLWGYAISQIPSGYLGSIWSPQKIFSIGVFGSGFINMTIPFTAKYAGWFAVCMCRLAMGLLQACLLSSLHNLVSKWAPPFERSRMSSFITAGQHLGCVGAMSASGVIAASSLGWEGIFYTFGSASLLASLVFFFCVADSPILHPTISEEEKIYITSSLQQECDALNKSRPPWKEIFSSQPMWAIVVSFCGWCWGAWIMMTGMPSYMEALGFDIAQNGLLSSLPYLASWLMGFPFSFVADWMIRRGVPVVVTRRIFNSIGMYLPAMVLIGLSQVDNNRVLNVVLLIVVGALEAAVMSGVNVNHIDLSVNYAGLMFSIGNCAGSTISIMAPIVCGAIVGDSMNASKWHSIFYLTAGVYSVTNTFYLIFAQGTTQAWNESEKKEKEVCTLSTVSNQIKENNK